MRTARTPSAKIVLHAAGLGVPSPDTVRQRAMELARIDGRNEYNDQDWQRARHELHGGHPEIANHDGNDEMLQSISERDMIATDAGHHVENIRPEPDNLVEELVAEGLDEAFHDQMLEAARMRSDETEEENA